jgi:hypothetical protein
MMQDTLWHPEKIPNGSIVEDKRRGKINFKLCNAIDLTTMGIVLDELVKAGMHPNLAKLYKAQAESLLSLLRSENNRIHGF